MKMSGCTLIFFQRVSRAEVRASKISQRNLHSGHRSSGFTLVEAILALTISVIAGSAIVLGLSSSLQTTQVAEDETVALGMAKQMMDEIASMRYAEAGEGPYQTTLGPEVGEVSPSGRAQFDDIDDFDGLSNQPPTDYWGIPLGFDDGEGGTRHSELTAPANRFTNWRREVDVYYANPTSFDTPLSGSTTSDYRVVVVRVLRTDLDGSEHELARMQRVFTHAASSGWRYGQGHADATQHARVSLERMMRTVREAYATADHPGCAVLYTEVGSWRFPDTLIVWAPEGEPQNPDGPPLANECVMFCPDPADPSQLVEIRAPSDTQAVPLEELNNPSWQSAIEAYKTAVSNEKVVLTDLLRTSQNDIGTAPRGAIRFERELRPSNSEWTAYQDPMVSLDWDELSWPQDLYGSNCGTRNVWIRVEMQLMPGQESITADPSGQQAVTFFDSASLSYSVEK
ncbi:unnamed protein product [Cladocopium goreaui]|uniref:Type II secretion system protein n=1 Tax=Cladocopium goreaui TaxID=2562237 RepID=A0A9P1BF30_9DINO|nr:unnamed protein product [Cladocopium goreaui]